MGQPFVGEIRIFAGNFPPVGWMFCDGAPLPISENDVLFQLIGTTYGGDGQETFNLPNLQGRVPVHQGTGASGTTYQMGEMAGVESVTLTVNQIPVHTHAFLATGDSGSAASPQNATPGSGTSITIFRPVPPDPPSAMAAQSISSTGGSQPHDNMQPYLCLNYIISLFGIFPSQN
jgi:microcystin-dependent protein